MGDIANIIKTTYDKRIGNSKLNSETISSICLDIEEEIFTFLEVKQALKNLTQEENIFNNNTEKTKKEYNIKRKELQERCIHPSTIFIEDAAGGNDSCYKCTICGIYL